MSDTEEKPVKAEPLKFCPLNKFHYCEGEKCAWYNSYKKCCVIWDLIPYPTMGDGAFH